METGTANYPRIRYVLNRKSIASCIYHMMQTTLEL